MKAIWRAIPLLVVLLAIAQAAAQQVKVKPWWKPHAANSTNACPD